MTAAPADNGSCSDGLSAWLGNRYEVEARNGRTDGTGDGGDAALAATRNGREGAFGCSDGGGVLRAGLVACAACGGPEDCCGDGSDAGGKMGAGQGSSVATSRGTGGGVPRDHAACRSLWPESDVPCSAAAGLVELMRVPWLEAHGLSKAFRGGRPAAAREDAGLPGPGDVREPSCRDGVH